MTNNKIIQVSYKKICEKSLFDILFYRRNALVMSQHIKNGGEIPHYPKQYFKWVQNQSSRINTIGINNWFYKTDGPCGPPKHITKLQQLKISNYE